ncbi:hypothetical protein TD95_005161 [Thielaviopsis punctulata]|uniref:HIT-type domain-containing protein n=1 Tax=Thielaviopsis punctulata TaxID=72032 RepID=A0A0F4ZBH2_9PEZI|nr:hypothetical protein TD95_005161 [Thielaviopsis punctulata]
MSNFGVVELASKRTTNAPGWAYVPDLGPAPSAALSSGKGGAGRKRAARNIPGLSAHDQSARQDARVQKELQALDRDGNRDATIAVPHTGKAAVAKHTPNVRRILQSQKTFANHLNDFEALLAQESASANTSSAAATGSSKRSKRAAAAAVPAASLRSTQPARETGHLGVPSDAGGARTVRSARSAAHVRDGDTLVRSWMPAVPGGAELRRLLAAAPRNYMELRAAWPAAEEQEGEDAQRRGGSATLARPPVRVFCEICGYWGKVRCTKCGVRVCALDCLNVHREECITRYGL